MQGAREQEAEALCESLATTPCAQAEWASLALVLLVRHEDARLAPCGVAGVPSPGVDGAPECGGGLESLAGGVVLRVLRHILPWTTTAFAGGWQQPVASCVATLALALQQSGAHVASAAARRQTELGLCVWRACRGLLSASDDAVCTYGITALCRVCVHAQGLGASRWPGGLAKAVFRWAVERQVLCLERSADGLHVLRSLRILSALVPIDPLFFVTSAHDAAVQADACPHEQGAEAGGAAGDWLDEEERMERAVEEEQAALCCRLLAEQGLGCEQEDLALLAKRVTPWHLRTLDACLSQMDATVLFQCEAACSLTAMLLAHLPPISYDAAPLSNALHEAGGSSKARRPPRRPAAAPAPGAAVPPWPLRCVEALVAMVRHVPPESSATADSPMCRMMRVACCAGLATPPCSRGAPRLPRRLRC